VKTLVLCGGAATAAVREQAAQGATLLAWTEAAEAALRAAGLSFRTLDETLRAGAQDEIDEAAIAWTRRFGRLPLLEGRSFREMLAWKGVSLWWFAELYLHHSTGATRRVRLIECFHRVLEQIRPDEVESFGLKSEEALLLARVCIARQVLCHGPRRAAPAAGARARLAIACRWNLLKCLASVIKARIAGGAPVVPTPDTRRTVLFLSHAAFWREHRPTRGGSESHEHYFGRLIPEVEASPDLRSHVVAVGPRAAFRRRGARERLRDWLAAPGATGPYVHIQRFLSWRVFREVARGTAEARAAWRALRRSPALHAAFSHRDVSFADLSEVDLGATLLLQLPWAVRCYEEMRAVLDTVPAAVVALYAESSGWGRAAVAACRAAGVPTVGIQHGILYPKYYSYRHEPDEDDCPRPDRTAVFGDAARRFLIDAGHYDPASLTVTGSPKFDALLEASRAWRRESVRCDLGLDPATRVVLVASRFRGIRETHQSIGSAFPGLLRAVESLPAVQLLVKPHPAEPAAAYAAGIGASHSTRARVLPATGDLVKLLFAADVLVTVESLSAVEALVLDRPVVVLNMPTNLAEMVEAGAALGVAAGDDPRAALSAVLDDPLTRERLAAARRRYLGDVARGVDGQAAARILELFREAAGGGSSRPAGA
jgi:glycosyltransferase involved in cell wall biosynthesis